jgi:hypothetical protein
VEADDADVEAHMVLEKGQAARDLGRVGETAGVECPTALTVYSHAWV